MPFSLYPFQQEAVNKFFTVSKGRMIAALPTGTGKTIVALAIINKVIEQEPDAKVLVIVPANLRNNLLENIVKLRLKLDAKVVTKTDQLQDAHDNYHITIISYNFLRMHITELLKYNWDMLVTDEIHYAKNYGTKNFQYLWLLSSRVKYFLGLTASYVSNRLEEFFTIIALVANDKNIIKLGRELIQYEVRGSYKPGFVSRVLYNAKTQKGKLVEVGVKDPQTFTRLVDRYIYLPKSEKILVIGKRPKPISIVKRVYLTKKEWSIYRYVQKDIPKFMLQLLSSGEINDDQLRQIKNQIMALQQVLITPDYILNTESKTPSSKVVACAKHILNYKRKAIVFTPFLEYGAKVVDSYFRSVGIKSQMYAGPIKPQDRLKIRDDFENGEIDVLVLTNAGKEGINLPSAEEVHFLSLTWNPEDLEQIMGRALRITSTHEQVYVYWYMAYGPRGEETIDLWMSNVLERKRLLKKVIYQLLSEMSVSSLLAYESLPEDDEEKYIAPNGTIYSK